MAASKRHPTNQGSFLLEDRENRTLFELLGKDNYALASGVAQLLVGKPEVKDYATWHKRHAGVVCIVKDYSNQGYFLRLYDLELGKLWQRKLDDKFKMKLLAPDLLSFGGDGCVFGLHFSSPKEAEAFKAFLDRKYEVDQLKKNRSGSSSQQEEHSSQQERSPPPPPPLTLTDSDESYQAQSPPPFIFPKKSKGKKTKLTTDMIGVPTNFRHIAHMGWEPGKGFTQEVHEEEELEPTVKDLLKCSGFDIDKLTKRDRKAIDQMAGECGGFKRMNKLLKDEQKQIQVAKPKPDPSCTTLVAKDNEGVVESSGVDNKAFTQEGEELEKPKKMQSPRRRSPRPIRSPPLPPPQEKLSSSQKRSSSKPLSSPQLKKPSSPQLENLSSHQSEKPSILQLEKPSIPQLEKQSSPQLEKSSSPQLEKPSSPQLEKPSSPQLEKPSSPQLEKPSLPQLENRSSHQSEKPSIPQLEKQSSPQLENSSIPQLEKPSSPLLEKPSSPQLKNRSSHQSEKSSSSPSQKPESKKQSSAPQSQKTSSPPSEKLPSPQSRNPPLPQSEKPSLPQPQRPSLPEPRKPMPLPRKSVIANEKQEKEQSVFSFEEVSSDSQSSVTPPSPEPTKPTPTQRAYMMATVQQQEKEQSSVDHRENSLSPQSEPTKPIPPPRTSMIFTQVPEQNEIQEDEELEPTVLKLLKFYSFKIDKLTENDRQVIDQLAGEYGAFRQMAKQLEKRKRLQTIDEDNEFADFDGADVVKF